MSYNPLAHTVVSIDSSGMIEYWTPEKDHDFALPKAPVIDWEFKSDTDLYEFKKVGCIIRITDAQNKCVPSCLVFAPTYHQFATFGFDDRQIRIFNFKTGKLVRKYDESLTVISEMQQAGTAVMQLDDMEFGRRLALERELGKAHGGQAATANLGKLSLGILIPNSI